MQLLLKHQQLLPLSGKHLGHWNPRPSGNNLSDLLGFYLLLQKRLPLLDFVQLHLRFGHLLFELVDGTVPDGSHSFVISLPFGSVSLQTRSLNRLLQLPRLLDHSLFQIPLCTHAPALLLQVRQFLPVGLKLCIILLPLQCLSFDFELPNLSFNTVQLLRH